MPLTTTQKIANLFHLGKLPAKVKQQMQAEGKILYSAEGIWEEAIFLGLRGPGVYIPRRKVGFVGSFALSGRRIVAKTGACKIDVNVAFNDPKFKSMTFRAHRAYLSLKFDVSAQMPRMTGHIELRLYLPDIDKVVEILESKGAVVTP